MTRFRLRRARRGAPGWLVLLPLLVAVTIVAGIPYALAARDARRPPLETHLVRLELPSGGTLSVLQQARVYEVIDGDTIDVMIDGRVFRVRYFGIDAPEAGERCHREALDRNRSLAGKTVLLLADARDSDRFGRLLRYVFLPDGVSVDATLVAEGFARAWRDDGRYRDDLVRLEQEARAAGRGCLWR